MSFSSIRLCCVFFLFVNGAASESGAQEPGAAPQAGADSTAGRGGAILMADSLTAVYAGREGLQDDSGAPRRTVRGQLSYERTLTPLNHAGENVFQSVVSDSRLRDAVRRLNGNPTWHPFQPGRTLNIPYNYHYGLNGATKASHILRGSLQKTLTPSLGGGYRFDTRYYEFRGPLPNEHTTRLDGLLSLTLRHSPSHLSTFRLLGIDNGWHVNRGNTVFTDRARYMLEGLNTWRARTGGAEMIIGQQSGPSVSYRFHVRMLSSEWMSEPPDTGIPLTPGNTGGLPPADPLMLPPEARQYVDGLFSVTFSTIFEAARAARTISLGGDLTFKTPSEHDIRIGVQARLHRLRRRQIWQTLSAFDAFDLTIQPRDFAIFFSDRYRFGALIMGLGLRYDVYQTGGAAWRDTYRTLGDDRGAQEVIRQLLLSAGGDSKGEQLISPHISVSYPSGSINTRLSFSVASNSPTLEDIYTAFDNPSIAYADGAITDLRPQRMTTLEGGVGISRDRYTADVTAFYRDSERYITVFGPEVLPQSLSNYPGHWGRINRGFREQEGIEAVLTRRSAPVGRSRARLSARLSYLYLFDLGPVRGLDQPLTPGNPLDPGDITTFDRYVIDFWNRRHWISLAGALRFPSGITLTGASHFQSGAPYRSRGDLSAGQTVLPGQENNIRSGPWVHRIDTRIDVPVRFKPIWPTVTFFIEAKNLSDDTIIDNIADPRVFEATGQPDNAFLNQTQWIYGPARSIWSGIGLRW